MARRQKLKPDGKIELIEVPDCNCVGIAQRNKPGISPFWTEGRRGPPVGVCGSCGGAIPRANQQITRE